MFRFYELPEQTRPFIMAFPIAKLSYARSGIYFISLSELMNFNLYINIFSDDRFVLGNRSPKTPRIQ